MPAAKGSKPTRAQYRTEFTTPSDRELVARRVFDAPRQLVWEVHTVPKHVQRWLLGPDGWTMPICEMDVRPGGRWRYGWRNDAKGQQFEMTGVYREVKAPERLVNTETWGAEWPETVNTTVFTEKGGKTTVTTTVLYASKEARDGAIKTGMESGWDRSYERLDDYLRTTDGGTVIGHAG